MTNSELKEALKKIHKAIIEEAEQELGRFTRLKSWEDRIMEDAVYDRMSVLEEIANNLARSIKALEELKQRR